MSDDDSVRLQLLADVAQLVPRKAGDDCVLVGVDGVDGAGKTIFANGLAAAVRSLGRPVVRISVDDFHQIRAVRYRRGRDSPEGFWLDSFNYDRLREYVLDPLQPGGDRRYRPACHDLQSDLVVRPPLQTAPPGAVIVIDGLFLHRDGLVDRWDLSLWLDVSFEITARRMAIRDGTNRDPQHPSMVRYVEAQRSYLAACRPGSRANVVIDNSQPSEPRLLTAQIHLEGAATTGFQL